MEDHHWTLVLDDLGVDLPDPGQAAGAPVAQDEVVFHLEIGHFASPQILGNEDRGDRPGEQPCQAQAQAIIRIKAAMLR